MGLERINIFKQEAGMTNKELSVKSGIPKSTIDKITSGLTSNPALETVKALTFALEKTLDDLIDPPECLSKPTISSAEVVHIKKYRDLDEYGRELIDIILDREYSRIISVK